MVVLQTVSDLYGGVPKRQPLRIGRCHANSSKRANARHRAAYTAGHEVKKKICGCSSSDAVQEFKSERGSEDFAGRWLNVAGALYVPFKINSRGETGPGIWEKMHAQFTLDPEEFLRHYHAKTNVESTFSRVKRKSGDVVESKTDIAIKNEVLSRVLCQNVVVVIHEMHELGIDPAYGERTSGEPQTCGSPQ